MSTGHKRDSQHGNFSSFLPRFDEATDVGLNRFRR